MINFFINCPFLNENETYLNLESDNNQNNNQF